MNIDKVFEFIKDKRGYDYPFEYKLLNNIKLSEEDLKIKKTLNLSYSNITHLPDDLYIRGYLDLRNSKIIELPDNLYVWSSVNISNTLIDSIPYNLKVELNLILDNTPLSKKYTEKELRKIIIEKGGYVDGYIVTR